MKHPVHETILDILMVVFSAGAIIFCGMAVQVDCRYRSGRESYEKVRQAAWGGFLPDSSQYPFPDIRMESLKRQNEDYLFWLYIPGTEIDYPVMRHEDNRYYLNHTFDGEENPCGSIFVDSSTGNSPGENTIINGHNMRDNSMFGGLKKYEKQQYYRDHPDLWIDCGDGWLRGRIFSCRIVRGGDREAYQTCFELGEKAVYLQTARTDSLYDTGIVPGEDGKLLTLSTCRGGVDKLLVQAVLDETE